MHLSMFDSAAMKHQSEEEAIRSLGRNRKLIKSRAGALFIRDSGAGEMQTFTIADSASTDRILWLLSRRFNVTAH